MFIIGKKIKTLKGYYYTLLSNEESEKVRPTLEALIEKRAKQGPNRETRRSSQRDNTEKDTRSPKGKAGKESSKNGFQVSSAGSDSRDEPKVTTKRKSWKDKV